MQNPLVSVIITTKNEEKNIRKCLKSVRKQTYPNVEMIVVDNKSRDDTKKIARSFTKKVYDKGPERSAQRNYGIEQSSAEYLLYLDADMLLAPGVIKECVETISKKPEIVGLYIPERIVGSGFWIKVRNFERGFYDGTVIDCVRFVSSEAFKRVGGFDLSMTGPEDWDFDKKIRSLGETAVIKSVLYHDEGLFDIKKYLMKKRYYSGSFHVYINKWGKDDSDIKKQLGAFYRLFGVFIERGKWHRLISRLHLAFGMYYLRFRVALNYSLIRRRP